MKKVENQNRLLSTQVVDDPFNKGQKETVVVNLRESSAALLKLGAAQTRAYNHVWSLFYKLGAYKNAAIDPSNPPVDCQQSRDPLPESALIAGDELAHLSKTLGDHDWLLIRRTCLDGMTAREIASIQEGKVEPTRTEIERARAQIGTAWNRLAVELGYGGTVNFHSRLKSWKAEEKDKKGVDRA